MSQNQQVEHIIARLRMELDVLKSHDWVTGKSSGSETKQNFLDCLNRTRPITEKEKVLAELAMVMEKKFSRSKSFHGIKGPLQGLNVYVSPKGLSEYLGLKFYIVWNGETKKFEIGNQRVKSIARDANTIMTPADFRSLERRLQSRPPRDGAKKRSNGPKKEPDEMSESPKKEPDGMSESSKKEPDGNSESPKKEPDGNSEGNDVDALMASFNYAGQTGN